MKSVTRSLRTLMRTHTNTVVATFATISSLPLSFTCTSLGYCYDPYNNSITVIPRRNISIESDISNRNVNDKVSSGQIPPAADNSKNSSNNIKNNNGINKEEENDEKEILSPQQNNERQDEKASSNSTINNNEAIDVEETHPDFQPRIIATDLAEDEVAMIKKDIKDTISEEDIVVFIKGVPEAPMCAFSKRLIDILEVFGVEYTSFDVLAHPVVRSYVKELSEWPTIPQLFIKGEFVGGMDIVMKMTEKGEMQSLLAAKGIKHR